MEEDDRVAEALGEVDVIGSQDHRRAGQTEQLEALDQVELRPVVQRQGGFVEEQDGGPVHQGLDEIEPPLHPK